MALKGEQYIQAGRVSQMVLGEIRPIIKEREEVIISVLLRKHRDDDLSNEFMRASVAGISELRLLISHLDRSIKIGSEAATKMMEEEE